MRVVFLLACCSMAAAFAPPALQQRTATTAIFLADKKKGFGKVGPEEENPVSKGAQERERASSKYDEIAATGGQEYSIYVRQFGGDDKSWLPCGAIAVPRNAQVGQAIKANQSALQAAIVRTFPKLKGLENEFEYGSNLKIYPDDPVEVANLNTNAPSQGFSVQNWISTLLSPVDTSGVPPPPIKD